MTTQLGQLQADDPELCRRKMPNSRDTGRGRAFSIVRSMRRFQ